MRSPAADVEIARSRPPRLAEVTGVLSLSTDLAMGQPLEHGLRTAILAVRIAGAMELPEGGQLAAYYVGLLHFAGCTAESEIDAQFFGNELLARPQLMAAYLGPRRGLVAAAMRSAHPERAPLARAAVMARSAVGGLADFRKWAASHCDVARLIGARMGLPDGVQDGLRHLYERWDGKGMPGELRGEQIPLPVRIMQVAQDADIGWQHGGAELAHRVLARRSGAGLDPQVVARCTALGAAAFAGLAAPSVWDAAMRAEPGPQPCLPGERMDACLSAIADFADMKSMWTVGHSRAVADVAERSAAAAGLPASEVSLLRRAALVHDIGRVAVPVGVWASAGPLSRDEHEKVRLHAYHGERVLQVAAALQPMARLAGSHGERCDGSGYHRGSRAGDLPLTAWLLATADCYQAMREHRAHRPALSAESAADELCREAMAGRLPREAVTAVLTAAGQPRRAVPRPASLSDRECEVLGLLARGLSTKQIAGRLGISPKTCDNHIQRVYGKAGVSSRAGATMFALEHGLLGPGVAPGAGSIR